MAVQRATKEVTSFSKGIITEASPLTFPDNASISENNLTIENDGSRKRRFGMDCEPGYSIISTAQSATANLAFSSFVWKSPGGYSDKEFAVIQAGSQIFIFDSTKRPVSSNLIYSFNLSIPSSSVMSFASTDGLLIVTTNTANINVFDWNGTSVTRSTGRLKIRDLFGVADTISGTNLLEGNGITVRPSSLTSAHVYNLRNQTFAIPRYIGNSQVLRDTIDGFEEFHVTVEGSSKFPSNSDSVIPFLYADANDNEDRNTRRYFSQDNVTNPLGTNRAPIGYFVIDALDRGASRMSAISALHSQYPQLVKNVSSLPTDRTPDGASAVSSFAGRIWYSGFSSKIVGGDTESPRMGSYVLFSRLVKSSSDVYICYQEGDPTSSEAPDLLDTDGGFIRLDGAYNIQKLINVGDALMVVAENGIWRITGGSGYGFKATDYLTTKVSEHGSLSVGAVVVVDNTLMYWSEDGIYHVAPNQYGDWTATSLTSNTIQSLFDEIPFTSKVRAQGLFDAYQRKVRWLYDTDLVAGVDAKELILDVNLGAFYTASVSQLSGVYPKPVSLIKVPPFSVGNEPFSIVDGSLNTIVDSSSDQVVVNLATKVSSTSELLYLTAAPTSGGNFRFTFSYYYNTSFKDWESQNGVGTDATAFLITGWSGFGDFQRQKQAPYLTVYCMKTETGFDLEYFPVNESSVLTQSQWSWTNLESGGKWGTPFQAYRHKRLWLPPSNSSGFDDGELVVKTRNKLRGRGNVLSLKFSTEPEKDFHLLGWSYILNVNGNP